MLKADMQQLLQFLLEREGNRLYYAGPCGLSDDTSWCAYGEEHDCEYITLEDESWKGVLSCWEKYLQS